MLLAIFITAIAAIVPANKMPPREATAPEIALIRAGMREDLLDADSAKFARVAIYQSGKENGILFACGMVNAKNSFGGYAGFHVFWAPLVEMEGKLVTTGIIAFDRPKSPVGTLMCKRNGDMPLGGF